MPVPTPPPAGTITMYSTTWCGYCRRLKTLLDREGIGYTEVNIETDADVGDASSSRPTTATRPSRPCSSRTARWPPTRRLDEVKDRLAAAA